MPSTIDRYIFREIVVPFMLGMAAFTGTLLIGRFLKIAEMVVSKGVPAGQIGLMFLYLMPSFALVTVPMSLLLAILLAFGRLSADSEIIAMKAGGMSLGRMMLPVMAFAALTTVATQAIAAYAAPFGSSAFKTLLAKTVEESIDIDIRERIFIDDIPGLVIYVDSYHQPTRTMKGVMIQDNRRPKDPLTIFARSGAIRLDRQAKQASLNLEQGSIHTIRESSYRLVNFREYDLNLKLDKAIRPVNRNEVDMGLQELKTAFGGSEKDPRMRKTMEIEYHRRFATPFACIVFALAAVPLGIQNRRSGKGGGFAVSIGMIILYYIVLSAFRTLGEKNLIHASLSMWAPNGLFLLLGGWLYMRAAAEKSVLGPLAPAAIADAASRLLSRWQRS